jgi:hypothetical protein
VVSALFFAHVAAAGGASGGSSGSAGGSAGGGAHLASTYASSLRIGLYATLAFLVVAVIIGGFDGFSTSPGRHEADGPGRHEADDGSHDELSPDSRTPSTEHAPTGSRT